jgi:hypothetical protein
VPIEFCPDFFFFNGARYYDCAELELVYSNIESVVSKILGCVGLRILTSVFSYLVRSQLTGMLTSLA